MPILGTPGATGNTALTLATGQTTQYSSELDDGYYEKGLAKAYTVLSTGQYSGASDLDLAHYTGTDIAFVSGTPDTITSTVLDFTTLFVAADEIPVSGAAEAANNAVHTIAAGGVAANVLTLTSSGVLTDEAAGETIIIAKREALSNNCVLDRNSGLMWARYTSAQNAAMGAASNGKMPWMGQLYDIFQWCAAANAASLGGYADWRIPNDLELKNLCDMEVPNALPDSTAFLGWSTADYYWSSTTLPSNTNNAMYAHFYNGYVTYNAKSSPFFASLCRGGV